MYEEGIAGMRYSISDTAEYGDLTRGPRVVDDHVRETMQTILNEIQSGKFAEEWVAEAKSGRKNFLDLEAAGQNLAIEEIGKELRGMMPWISSGKQSVKDTSGGQG
jgi:ketol-acid reductoisomerase